jgi:hypothetical protein
MSCNIKSVAFPLSDLGDPLLADAVRLFGVEQCIAQGNDE